MAPSLICSFCCNFFSRSIDWSSFWKWSNHQAWPTVSLSGRNIFSEFAFFPFMKMKAWNKTFQISITAVALYFVVSFVAHLTPFCCSYFDERDLFWKGDYSLPWSETYLNIEYSLQFYSPMLMLAIYLLIVVLMKIVNFKLKVQTRGLERLFAALRMPNA